MLLRKVLIGQTSTVSQHSHTRGTMDIIGILQAIYGWSNTPSTATGCFTATNASSSGFNNSASNGDAKPNSISFKASNNWSGSTSVAGNKNAYSLNVSCKYYKRIA